MKYHPSYFPNSRKDLLTVLNEQCFTVMPTLSTATEACHASGPDLEIPGRILLFRSVFNICNSEMNYHTERGVC
jgi:hypothetical protein